MGMSIAAAQASVATSALLARRDLRESIWKPAPKTRVRGGGGGGVGGGGGRARVCAAGGRFRAQLQSTPCRPAASPPRPLLTTATAQHIRAAPTAAASHAGTRLPRETNEHHVRFSRAHSAPHLAAASASSNVASMRVGGQKLRARKQRLKRRVTAAAQGGCTC
jgi:hypothetical protein